MKFALKMLQNRPGPDIFVQKISFYPARRAGRQGEEDRRQAGREPGGGRGDPRIRVMAVTISPERMRAGAVYGVGRFGPAGAWLDFGHDCPPQC